ncbi:MAG: lipo-like protein, partial [Pseudomonadota bacterium]|nr:lipo-like protein [Pseudomonadota bacterium]
HIRHHSLYTPRDFDISPYFEIVKPTLAKDFNYRNIEWSKHNQPTDF